MNNLYNAGEKYIRDQIKTCPSAEFLMQNDNIVSFSPADFLWGYSYHSHCIPPFVPESVLILGYGKGQIASLIRKIHGSSVKITGVDLVPQDYEYTEYKMVICDAKEFVYSCAKSLIKTRFDYIVVDLFDGCTVPDFVFDDDFARRLKQITKQMVCFNICMRDFDRLKSYAEHGFEFHRFVPIFGNNVNFWGV